MKLKEWVKGEGFLKSVELEPPRGPKVDRFMQDAASLAQHVDAIFLTDGARYQYRMSNLAAGSYLKRAGHMPADVVLHLTCRDHTKRGVQGLLLGASLFGLESILVLAGDGFKRAEGHFEGTPALIRMVSDLRSGHYIDGNHRAPLDFCVGAATNPYAADREKEIALLKKRVDAGAAFILTQPVYHLSEFYSFMADVKKEGIEVPILPGVLPLYSAEDAVKLREEFKLSIPKSVICRLQKGHDGVKIAVETAEKLREKGYRGIHFYARSKAELAAAFFSLLKG